MVYNMVNNCVPYLIRDHRCWSSSPLSSDASSPVLLGTPSVVFAPNSAGPVGKHSNNAFAQSDAGIFTTDGARDPRFVSEFL